MDGSRSGASSPESHDAGRFSRSACVPGSYTISVGDGGALRRLATVEIAGNVDLDLALERP